MSEVEQLNVWDAEHRAYEAADKLVEMIGNYDPSVREHLASQCMVLLTKRFVIMAPVPVSANTGTDDE